MCFNYEILFLKSKRDDLDIGFPCAYRTADNPCDPGFLLGKLHLKQSHPYYFRSDAAILDYYTPRLHHRIKQDLESFEIWQDWNAAKLGRRPPPGEEYRQRRRHLEEIEVEMEE